MKTPISLPAIHLQSPMGLPSGLSNPEDGFKALGMIIAIPFALVTILVAAMYIKHYLCLE